MRNTMTVLAVGVSVFCGSLVSLAGPNLLVNGDAETGDLTGWTDPLVHGFNLLNPLSSPFHLPHGGNYSFWAGASGPANTAWTNEIRQDVDISSYAAAIDAGITISQFSGWGRTAAAGAVQDNAVMTVEFLDAGSTPLQTFSSGVVLPVNTWVQVGDSRTVPIGTRTVRVSLLGTRSGGGSTDAFFDDLSLSVEPTLTVGVTTWGGVKALYR